MQMPSEDVSVVDSGRCCTRNHRRTTTCSAMRKLWVHL